MDFFVSLGYIGVFIGSFLGGSIVPFSSEILMVGSLMGGCKPWLVLICLSLGNTLGGMTCYWLGSLGKTDWMVKHKIVKQELVDRIKPKAARYGSYFGLLTWLPYAGEAIAVTLGLLRVNVWGTLLFTSIGKTLRYGFILLSYLGIVSLF